MGRIQNFTSTNFESCFQFFQLVTSTTDGDAKSRTKTEQEETCSKEVTSGGDGETFTISNTSTSRTTKTVASSNLPLPPDTDEAPSTDAKATDVTEEKQVNILKTFYGHFQKKPRGKKYSSGNETETNFREKKVKQNKTNFFSLIKVQNLIDLRWRVTT